MQASSCPTGGNARRDPLRRRPPGHHRALDGFKAGLGDADVQGRRHRGRAVRPREGAQGDGEHDLRASRPRRGLLDQRQPVARRRQGAQGGRQGSGVRLVRRAAAGRRGRSRAARSIDASVAWSAKEIGADAVKAAVAAARKEPVEKRTLVPGHRGRQGQRGRLGGLGRCPSPITLRARRPRATVAAASAAPTLTPWPRPCDLPPAAPRDGGLTSRRTASESAAALQGRWPELVEELEGIAGGAGQDPLRAAGDQRPHRAARRPQAWRPSAR